MHTRKISSRFILILVVIQMILAIVVGIVAPLSASASQIQDENEVQNIAAGPKVIIRVNPQSSDHYVPRRVLPLLLQETTATINVNYIPPGWTTEAQTAFQFAVNIWETLITSPVVINVDAEFKDLSIYGSGVLGAAGPETIHRNFTNAPRTATWYPQATANSLAGYDLSPANPDIGAEFNSEYTGWYFGTGASTPGDKISFASVVLHELGHGLGFLGSMDVDSGIGSYGWLGDPFIYDQFTENGAGTALISYTNNSAALASQLQSGDVFFDAQFANYANGDSRVELYAPNPWETGSSYSHLDEGFNGTPQALMTYSISPGETQHDPGAVMLCMFKDMGWTVAEECGVTAQSLIYLPLILKNFSSGAPPPDIPTLISPSNGITITNTTPTFMWSASSGATNYHIQIDNNLDFSSYEVNEFTTAVSYTPPVPLSGGPNFWRVRAGAGGDNWSAWSSVWTFTIATAQIPILNGDFEQGSTGWDLYSSHGWPIIVQGSQLPGSVTPHSGNWAAWLGGAYDDISYIEQTVTVPPSAPYFSYWHWIASSDACSYDFGGVLIDGSTVVDQYDLCTSANTGGWVAHSVNLSAYTGQTVDVQIRVETDSSMNSNLFVDDVSFTASALVITQELELPATSGSIINKSQLISPDKGLIVEVEEKLLLP